MRLQLDNPNPIHLCHFVILVHVDLRSAVITDLSKCGLLLNVFRF